MFISLILPTYNVGLWLEDCLASILRQDLSPEDYEAVFVDDGSTDDSAAILLRACSAHPQIRYIRQDNAGVSAARNRGLEEARGDYVWFVDPDDLIAPNAFRVLKAAAEEGSQRICFNYYNFTEHFTPEEQTAYEACALKAEPRYKDGTACAGILRRDWVLARQLRFRPTRHGEDALFMFELLTQSPRQTVLEDTLYYYRGRRDSASTEQNRRAELRRYESRRYNAGVMKDYYEGRNGPVPDRERCANLFMGFLHSALWSVCMMPKKQAQSELRSLKAEGLFPYKCPRECTLSKSYMTTRTDWYGKLFDFLYLRLNTRLGFGWMRCLLRLRQMGK